MGTLTANVILWADAKTYGEVKEWYALCQKLGLPDTTLIADGANAQVTGLPRPIGEYPTACLKDVAEWLDQAEQAGIPSTAAMTKPALDLAVELPTLGTELVGCGECTRSVTDVIVHLHDDCRATWVKVGQ
jgi:ABC-type Co2+ transport system permease subunit